MKVVGIVCDNYKLDKFKKELDKKNFKYEVLNFVGNKQIRVPCEDHQVKELKKLCQTVELHFKRSN